MRLNNKGFAITGILYFVLIMFLMIISSLLLVLKTRINRLTDLNDTINEANTAPLNVNTKGNPNLSTMPPIKEFLPKNNKRKNPTTVGGSTRGSVNIISNRDENFLIFTTIIATYIPTKKVIIVEYNAVFIESINGVYSIILFYYSKSIIFKCFSSFVIRYIVYKLFSFFFIC